MAIVIVEMMWYAFASGHCVSVNPKFFGNVWLSCTPNVYLPSYK